MRGSGVGSINIDIIGERNMADVKELAPFILKWEGGFVNDPDDLGGATNMGVTISTYEAYCKKKGYPKPTIERLKNLSKEEWTEIMKTMYWDRWKADEIKSQSVANILVDWVWASGIHGIKIPQELVGVIPDGIVRSNNSRGFLELTAEMVFGPTIPSGITPTNSCGILIP